MARYRSGREVGNENSNRTKESLEEDVTAPLRHAVVGVRRNRLLTDVYQDSWTDLCRYIRKTFGAGPPDPEDVVQTAFCKFAALDNPYIIKNPHAFLVTTARNIVFDHHKKSKTRTNYLKVIAEDNLSQSRLFDDLTPERVILGKEECDILRQALENMSKKRREMLILHRIHGMSYVELAKHSGLSQTTVKYHVAMAFSECLTAMEKAGLDPGNED